MESDNEDEEYEVERIVKKRIVKGATQYFVKWKGYPSSENTWEPEQHLKNAPLRVAEFNARLLRKSQPTAFKGSTNAFERGLMPEAIKCLINDGNQFWFLMKFLDQEELEMVSADLVSANCPILVDDFCKRIHGI